MKNLLPLLAFALVCALSCTKEDHKDYHRLLQGSWSVEAGTNESFFLSTNTITFCNVSVCTYEGCEPSAFCVGFEISENGKVMTFPSGVLPGGEVSYCEIKWLNDDEIEVRNGRDLLLVGVWVKRG